MVSFEDDHGYVLPIGSIVPFRREGGFLGHGSFRFEIDGKIRSFYVSFTPPKLQDAAD